MNQRNQQKRRNIFFYIPTCTTSQHLKNLLENADMLKYFEPISAVGKEAMLISEGITRIPALIVSDFPKPLIAEDAFKWLQSVKYIKYQAEKQQKIIQYNMAKNAMQGPKGFTNEMSGFSDTFAYTDIDLAQPKAFFGYKDEENNAIFTAPKEKTKLSTKEQNALINEEQLKRDKQQKEFGESMEKQRIDDAIRAEKERIMHSRR